MLTLNFNYLGGNGSLTFDEGSEVYAFSPIVLIPTTFVNGSVGPASLVTYYVDHRVAASGNGLSWGTALKKISEATNKPFSPGYKVLIWPGSYNDTLIIKSNGYEAVPLTFNVSVSDTNKITFPSSANLNCIDLAGYPDSYYAYVYRSWKGNNGAYKITSVNKTLKYVTVEGAAFVPETGASGDTSLLQASIGMPVIYQKFSSNPEAERVTLTTGIGPSGARAVVHIGKPTAAGAFNVSPANYNIIDGIDVTGVSSHHGVRIQNSRFNVYRNSWIYDLDSIGFVISGNTASPANNNFILGNRIYNTSGKAVKVGIQSETSPNNRANINHIKLNEIYSTASGTYINFINAIDISRFTGYTVLENNTIRNFKLKSINRGAVELKQSVRRVLAYANYLKNIDRVTTSNTHAVFYLQATGNNNNVFNNVIVDSIPLANSVYAFWVNVTGGYTGGMIAFNTVHNVDYGFKLDNSTTNVAFQLKNNIMNLETTSPVFFNQSSSGLFDVSHNCYSTLVPLGPYNAETGRIVGNPSFLQPTSYQGPYGFSLTSGSICLNTGTPVTGITSDFMKSNRSNTSPSRGAFENVITGITWNGAANTNWHDYRNWDLKMVPLSTFNVSIPDRSNDPVISGNNVSIKSLQVSPGAQLRVNSPRTLTLTN